MDISIVRRLDNYAKWSIESSFIEVSQYFELPFKNQCRPKERELARFNWTRHGLVYPHIKYQ